MRAKLIISFVTALLLCSSAVFGETINVPTPEHPTIQAGINAAFDSDTVLVQPGTYVENIDFNGKNITVGSLFLTTSDTSYISSTVIDGNEDGSVVKFVNGETAGAKLTGLTIQNGLIQFWTEGGLGGGVRINGATPTLSHLIIKNNHAYRGGGIYSDALATIKNIILENNTAEHFAGGIEISSSSTLENLLIANNLGNQGGGIHIYGGANVSIVNCTIVNNADNVGGGGIFVNSGGIATIFNSILRENQQYGIWLELQGPASTVSISYSNIENGINGIGNPSGWSTTWGSGNIYSDPLFCDAPNGDYHLQAASPCIDTGTDSGAPSTDIEGTTRPQGSDHDMGAYEYQPGVSTVSVSTVGSGSVMLDPPGGSYDPGVPVTLTAMPDPGWVFDSWSGNLTGSTNPVTIIIYHDYIINATFTNLPPVADAGPDQVDFDEFTLDGSGSSPVADIFSYAWGADLDGDKTYETPAGDEVVVELTSEVIESLGLYGKITEFQLIVTDDEGLTDTDTMLLAVAGSCDVADSDGDGEADPTDLCPETPIGVGVDGNGCSLSQFCSNIDVSTKYGRKVCRRSDWMNDEPLKSRGDCRTSYNGCIPR
jgi:hypothetical protein